MIGCKNVATLLSTDQLAARPAWHRAAVRLHLAICSPCRALRRQLTVLRHAAAALDARYDSELGADFADRVREKLTR